MKPRCKTTVNHSLMDFIGNCELLRCLEKKSYGSVYEGIYNGNRVCLKELNNYKRDQEIINKWLKLLTQLSGENIIDVYGATKIGDVYYLVEELGEYSLIDGIKKFMTLPSNADMYCRSFGCSSCV